MVGLLTHHFLILWILWFKNWIIWFKNWDLWLLYLWLLMIALEKLSNLTKNTPIILLFLLGKSLIKVIVLHDCFYFSDSFNLLILIRIIIPRPEILINLHLSIRPISTITFNVSKIVIFIFEIF